MEERLILEVASAWLRVHVPPRDWQVFELAALQNVPAKQVAAQLGMPLSSVYEKKKELLEKLQERVRRFDEPDSG